MNHDLRFGSGLVGMGEADKVKVFDLMNHLRKAFDEFFEQSQALQPHEYSMVDIFMAAHNFHKLTVLSLAADAAFTPSERNMFLKTAAHTFTLAMEAEMKT